MQDLVQSPEVLVRALIQDEAEEITRKAIMRAKRGDSAVLRSLMKVLAQKEKPVDIGAPQTAAELAAAQLKIVAAVSSGQLTPREGLDLGKLLDFAGAALGRSDLEARLVAIESKNEKIAPPVKESNQQLKRLTAQIARETEYFATINEVSREALAFLKDGFKPLTADQQKARAMAQANLDAVLANRSMDITQAEELRGNGMLKWRDVELAFDEVDRAIGREPYRTLDNRIWQRHREKFARSRRKAPTFEEPPLPLRPVKLEKPVKPPKAPVRPRRH